MLLCHGCGNNFSTPQSLWRHCKTSCKQDQNQKIHKCPECDQRFKRKDTLGRHLKSRHIFEKETFECLHCSKKLASKWSHEQHVRRKHENKKKQPEEKVCGQCRKTFSRIDSMRRHSETCHKASVEFRNNHILIVETSFQCNDCNKRYRRKDNLLRHMKYHMFGKKTLVCHLCSRRYSQRGTLKKHLSSCLGESVNKFSKQKPHRLKKAPAEESMNLDQKQTASAEDLNQNKDQAEHSDEDFKCEVILEEEDFSQKNTANKVVTLDDYRKEAESLFHEYLQSAHTPGVIQEITKKFVVPIQPILELYMIIKSNR